MNRTTALPEEFRLGHVAIDFQHDVLFALYNEMSNILSGKMDHSLIADVFSGLRLYVRIHFKYEEGLMKESNYPGREQHEQEHRDLERRVVASIDRYRTATGEEEKRTVVLDIQAFLLEWLTEHISKTDRALCEHLER